MQLTAGGGPQQRMMLFLFLFTLIPSFFAQSSSNVVRVRIASSQFAIGILCCVFVALFHSAQEKECPKRSTAIILSVFCGSLGADRFYLGYFAVYVSLQIFAHLLASLQNSFLPQRLCKASDCAHWLCLLLLCNLRELLGGQGDCRRLG